MQIELIPVSKLSISARNVRRTTSTAPIDGLKADIKARGVLQNLIAVPANGRKKGRYEVTAGGRRLTALQALIAEGTLPPDHPVPVMVLSDTAQAGETSLAENFQRAGMNPADECIAFRHFVEEDGSTVEDIARRFGITTRFVEGRLRLAQLAEPVFEALRAGAITLDLAQAFGTTADTRRQEEVWEECKQKSWMLNARHVRQRLTEDVITGHHPVAQFVGEEAYLAAGGEIERDLFGDERETFWKTPDLLARLASEKMDAVAQAMKAEEGFAHVGLYGRGARRGNAHPVGSPGSRTRHAAGPADGPRPGAEGPGRRATDDRPGRQPHAVPDLLRAGIGGTGQRQRCNGPAARG